MRGASLEAWGRGRGSVGRKKRVREWREVQECGWVRMGKCMMGRGVGVDQEGDGSCVGGISREGLAESM